MARKKDNCVVMLLHIDSCICILGYFLALAKCFVKWFLLKIQVNLIFARGMFDESRTTTKNSMSPTVVVLELNYLRLLTWMIFGVQYMDLIAP